MAKSTSVKNYKWDIAISLCKQDFDFAKKLVKAINPSLKVFFYEDRQEELISKSGPVEFARIFKEESRVIVILSRNEWSNSYYTEIERNAIIDRTAVKNEGYQFLLVIPIVQGEIPSWYPSTQIYASPFRFSIEELAHFIEFKVSEEGGIVRTLTVEDRYQEFLNKIDEKKAIIRLQQEKSAIQTAKDEIIVLKNCFNSKIDFLRKRIVDSISYYHFNLTMNRSYFRYGDFLLECNFLLDYDYDYYIVTTQDVVVTFKLFKTFGNDQNKKLLEGEERVFYFTPELKGWAQPHLIEQPTKKELQVLFRNRDNSQFYDLTNIMLTGVLVDSWFQRLLSKSTEAINRYI